MSNSLNFRLRRYPAVGKGVQEEGDKFWMKAPFLPQNEAAKFFGFVETFAAGGCQQMSTWDQNYSAEICSYGFALTWDPWCCVKHVGGIMQFYAIQSNEGLVIY